MATGVAGLDVAGPVSILWSNSWCMGARVQQLVRENKREESSGQPVLFVCKVFGDIFLT